VDDFRYETWKRDVEDDFLVVPQIESSVGLQRLDEIATHEITTAMGIGPYDLSMDLGVGAQMDHEKMKEAIALIRSAALRAGKSMWRIGHGPTMVAEGFHFLCIGEPMGMLKGALAQARQETLDAVK
jgi:2-keto-3-deoxy-L-rhamnonate aldolase RhmA